MTALRITHCADIHLRGLARHDEHRKVIGDMCEWCVKRSVDVITVCGDVWHTKTQGVTHESVELMCWMFKTMSDAVGQVYVLLGNHDISQANLTRQDAMSPIVGAIDRKNVTLFKRSGRVQVPGRLGWEICAFSCFDSGDVSAWERAKPDSSMECPKIALFHGGVAGAMTDDGWSINAETDVAFFENAGISHALLGDVHSRQFLATRLTPDGRQRPWIGYPGSIMTQGFGERGPKGFFAWEISSRDEFDVEFVELVAPHPHVTVNWAGSVDDTARAVVGQLEGARYRVNYDAPVTQLEIRRMHAFLKDEKKAKEIAHRIVDQPASVGQDASRVFAARSGAIDATKTHFELIEEFVGKDRLDDRGWERAKAIVARALSAPDLFASVTLGVQWTIKRLEFDNVLGYGKGNVIDFSSFDGVIGIFAPNRSGKSSVIGALMYALFNAVDRGPIKGAHVINFQKGHCRARVDVAVGGQDYAIERQTVRRDGQQRQPLSTTHVNFFRLGAQGAIVEDLNGIQRSDTDKNIRTLIGQPDDFLMTALSAQDDAGRFLCADSSQRKASLLRILGLDAFEAIAELVRRESSGVRACLAEMGDRDPSIELADIDSASEGNASRSAGVGADIAATRDELAAAEREFRALSSSSADASLDELERVTERIASLESGLDRVILASREIGAAVAAVTDDIALVAAARSSSDADALRVLASRKRLLEIDAATTNAELSKQVAVLDSQEGSVAKLSGIPCGAAFPTCRYICDAHADSSRVAGQRESVDRLKRSLSVIETALADPAHATVDSELERVSKLELALANAETELARLRLEEAAAVSRRVAIETELGAARAASDELRAKTSPEAIAVLASARRRVAIATERLSHLESLRVSLAEERGKLAGRRERVSADRDRFVSLKREWDVYEALALAASKKGVAARALASVLPAINGNIAAMLSGVVGFKIELAIDEESSSLDAYIDDGASRRPFELASGMERFVGSLAIRVALIGASSMPKPDVLFIDEGFGSLDPVSMGAVATFLNSLRNRFRTVIIVTHVESLKDAVDDVIEISRDEDGLCSRVSYP